MRGTQGDEKKGDITDAARPTAPYHMICFADGTLNKKYLSDSDVKLPRIQ